MKNQKLKILGICVAGIVIILCFMQALNIQPAVLGDSDDKPVPVINQFNGFNDSNSVCSDLMAFDSYEDLKDFLTSDSGIDLTYSNGSPRLNWATSEMDGELAVPMLDSKNLVSSSGGGSSDFSETNVQVAGVDEPDIIKTDGEYLYVISDNKVFIIKAFPADEAVVVSKIEVNSSLTIQNLFINGDKLVVFATDRSYPIYSTHPVILEKNAVMVNSSVIGMPNPRWYSSPDTHLQVYDISNKKQPELEREIVTPGSFTGARMIGNHVYLITVQNSYNIRTMDDDELIVPTIMVDGKLQEISLSNIQYVQIPEQRKTITNVVSVDLDDEDEKVEAKMFLLGNSQTLYVSQHHIYVVYSFRSYNYEMLKKAVKDILEPMLPESLKDEMKIVQNLTHISDSQKKTVIEWMLQNFTNSLDKEEKLELYKEINSRFERTVIHKIKIRKGNISYVSKGEIPGRVKNQFSLSEHNGNLRVSSTIEGMWLPFINMRMDEQNGVYVLDETLDVIGSVEGLAPDEDIYATRFVGDIGYLVTFRQIDPFFVIDLSDPTEPLVLGELKIPGYSTYLHPYDDDHIIGIGKEGRHVKISLFDVTNFSNPKEIAKYEIEESSSHWSWSQSSALNEHKAFLFDQEKNLLVIPSGTYYKQSAYVFDINVETGISLKGVVTHESEESENSSTYSYRYSRDYSVKRSLYIDNVLYTISDKMIKMNSLDDLSEINTVDLI